MTCTVSCRVLIIPSSGRTTEVNGFTLHADEMLTVTGESYMSTGSPCPREQRSLTSSKHSKRMFRLTHR